MKTIIAGSRSIVNYLIVKNAIKKSEWENEITEVVSGHAHGVDRLGERWANFNNIPIKIFTANWAKHGRKAGYIRNIQMGEYADALIAVWNNKSRGTKHMIDTMFTFKKPVFIHRI